MLSMRMLSMRSLSELLYLMRAAVHGVTIFGAIVLGAALTGVTIVTAIRVGKEAVGDIVLWRFSC